MPVAELAVTLMLDVLRNVVPLNAKMKEGEWVREQYSARSYLLHGKTVGLIGIGNIARKVASIVRSGFDAQVLYYDVFRLSEEQERSLGVVYADLDTLMAQAAIKKKASEDKTFELMETDLAAYAARHKATTEKRFTSAGGEVPQFGSYTELYKL